MSDAPMRGAGPGDSPLSPAILPAGKPHPLGVQTCPLHFSPRWVCTALRLSGGMSWRRLTSVCRRSFALAPGMLCG